MRNEINQISKSNLRTVYINLFVKYGFLVFLLLWGEPDILGGISEILKAISDCIRYGIGGGVG